MNNTRLALVAFAAVCGAGLAQAQTAPPPPPGPPMSHQWDPAAMRQKMEARRAHHLQALHDILEIRPEQEAAFQAFAASMHPEPRGPNAWGKSDDRRAPGQHEALTTPERLDLMAKRFDERVSREREAMEHHATAVKALYAALSPAQQKTLDALPALAGGGERRGGWDRHGGGMPRGPHGPGEGMGPPADGE